MLLLLPLLLKGGFRDTLYDEAGIGGGVVFGSKKYTEAFTFKFKTISTLSEDFSGFFLSERSSYHDTKNNNAYSKGLMVLGAVYHPWESQNHFRFFLGGGWAQNMNYTTLFDDFMGSFTFGSAFYSAISYQITPLWNVELSYAKYHFTKERFDGETLLLTVNYMISLKKILKIISSPLHQE